MCARLYPHVRLRLGLGRLALAGGLALGLLEGCGFWRKPPSSRPTLVNPALDAKLTDLLRFDVPLVSAAALRDDSAALVLDARDWEEFRVSHIAGARHVDPGAAVPHWLDTVSRGRRIVVYCSVGYRSEGYARELRSAGFTEVSNLYGSLFEWADRGYPVVDSTGRPASAIHTYNRRWSRWVSNPALQKVW